MKTEKQALPDQGILICEDGDFFPYRIVKSARRTMAVSVTREGEIVVRIPDRLSWKAGHEFAQRNQEWIFAHASRIREELEKREQFHWTEGALLLFHGSPRKLHFERAYETERFRVCDTGDKFLVSGPFTGQEGDEPLVKAAMENWYRKQARRFLEERTAWWADRMGVSYLRIAIRDQATRWGSCSACGNINYNWKLVLLPVELADYVVVHELAHRTEMNHSKDFWKVVERELPDYRQRRRRLKGYESEINQKYQD